MSGRKRAHCELRQLYSFPTLFRDLYAHGLEHVEHSRSHRKGVPDEIQTAKRDIHTRWHASVCEMERQM